MPESGDRVVQNPSLVGRTYSPKTGLVFVAHAVIETSCHRNKQQGIETMDVKKSHYRCDSASDVVSDATDETLDECCRAVKRNFQTLWTLLRQNPTVADGGGYWYKPAYFPNPRVT